MKKFDFCIGNPPYQEEDGGASASARPVYQHFVDSASDIANAACLVMPARWYTGGKGLDEFRDAMLDNTHVKALHDFPNTNEVFKNVNIRGGVCVLQLDNHFDNSGGKTKVVTHEGAIENIAYRPLRYEGINVFIRNYEAISILEKTHHDVSTDSLANHVSPRRPFGLGSEFSRSNAFHLNADGLTKPVKCIGKRRQIGFIEFDDINSHQEWISVWKVFVPRANNIGTELNDDNLNSFPGETGTVCTEAYIAIGMDLNLDEKSAEALTKYLQTKFARFLHSLAKSSQDASSKTYQFIPNQVFTKSSDIDWSQPVSEIDQQLYKKYGFTDKEIQFIESHIKEMN